MDPWQSLLEGEADEWQLLLEEAEREGEFEMELKDIEQAVQARLDLMAKMDDYPIEDWLRAYEVLAQVKQAQHLEFIAQCADTIQDAVDHMASWLHAIADK